MGEKKNRLTNYLHQKLMGERKKKTVQINKL